MNFQCNVVEKFYSAFLFALKIIKFVLSLGIFFRAVIFPLNTNMMKIVTFSRDPFRKAVEIACQAHAGQTDKIGVPKFCHCVAVANRCASPAAKCVAILHDTLEDTPLTVEDLLALGVDPEVVEAVKILTHDKQTSYLEYIQSIIDSRNPLALEVKRCDLADNTDPTRCEASPSTPEKQELYKQAKKMLGIGLR